MYHLIITILPNETDLPTMDLTSTAVAALDQRQKDEIRYAILSQATLIAKSMIDQEMMVGDTGEGPEPGWEYRAALQKLVAAGALTPRTDDDEGDDPAYD